jgi:signal transduction histidine kinase
VLTRDEQVRVADLPLACGGTTDQGAIVDLIAYPIEFAEERYVAIVLRDVTERRRLERQTRLTEAMEATVTLARGVAHDFNSLLTSAIGSLSTVTSEAGNGRAADRVRRALRACDQAVGLSRALLSFAGGDRGNPEVLRLRETVELILESMEEAFFENIRLQTDLDETVCARIDRDQFTQIVLNLVQNAREAMPAGGQLRLEILRGRVTSSGTTDAPPTHAILSISDTGCGISPETEKRLFEPFFSTKDEGTGRRRGMGLATVYAAVKNANGAVQVDGKPGIGATFRVCLPLAESAEVE